MILSPRTETALRIAAFLAPTTERRTFRAEEAAGEAHIQSLKNHDGGLKVWS